MIRVSFLVLMGLALLAAGCQVDPVSMKPEQARSLLPEEKGTNDLDPKVLLQHYEASLEAEYEVFEGLYTPGTDAILGGIIESWPGTYGAGIKLSAGSLPLDYGPVTLSIAVPRFRKHVPYEDQPPMVVILEPDGIEFLEPVEILVSNPPWLEAEDGNPLFKIYCMLPLYLDGELERVGYSDFHWLNRDELDDPQNRLIFEVEHFSRWEADQDDPHDETQDPDERYVPPDVLFKDFY